MARMSSIGRAMALRSEAWQRQGTAVQSKGYEVNCCAVALRSTDGQGEGIASRAMRREGMAEKSADVICEGKVVHRNDSLRQGFASDALAWQRDTLRRQSKEKAFY
nr:MAG TPA: hypothetical protein [Caudoviricetes sp.]